MKIIKQQAKTVDEAIRLGLEKLDADRDDVEVKVLEEGNSGFLGFLSKDAKVKLILKPNHLRTTIKFLTALIKLTSINATFKAREEGDFIKVDFTGKDMGILIGRHGKTLDAIQFLTSIVVNKENDGFKRIVIDAENYRKRREQSLQKFARNMARKAQKIQKDIVLEPMLPNERRLVHMALQDSKKIETKSIGEDPNRRVVISLK